MTTDELRNAAELVVATGMHKDWADTIDAGALAVCRQWLAEHPDDDDHAIDAAWLRAVGFRTIHSTFAVALVRAEDGSEFRFRLRCEDHPNAADGCAWSIETLGPGGRELAMLPCQPTTRGSVRLLCRALGITLKESPTSEGTGG